MKKLINFLFTLLATSLIPSIAGADEAQPLPYTLPCLACIPCYDGSGNYCDDANRIVYRPSLAPDPVTEVAPDPVAEVVPDPVAEVVPAPVAEVVPAPVAEVAPAPVVQPAPSKTKPLRNKR